MVWATGPMISSSQGGEIWRYAKEYIGRVSCVDADRGGNNGSLIYLAPQISRHLPSIGLVGITPLS